MLHAYENGAGLEDQLIPSGHETPIIHSETCIERNAAQRDGYSHLDKKARHDV